MKTEVLVTTMFQKDFSLVEKMNIQTDAIIANQCDTNEIKKVSIDGKTIKLVSTISRGLSKNRNIAIINSTADLIVFADDDIVFVDNYENMIASEFVKHPNVQAIKFNLKDLSTIRKLSMKPITKFEKATRRNMSSSGVVGLAIKRDVLCSLGICFNENFGSGTENYCGEDTIFLQELINKKVKLFRSPLCIAGIDQSVSSWFDGYTGKYFYVIGKVFATIYPKLSYLLAIRSAIKFTHNKKCNLKFNDIIYNYFRGIKEIKGKVEK